ncbi:unnamed protein product [Closterium sp. Naga37s-1]|nr:unnamed protein product [Closterium sp. Naga37s-1]
MAYSRTAAVVVLLLHAACLSSLHRLVAGHVWPLSEASRREMAVKAPPACPAGVVCPTGAYCVVDSGGFPFCKCLSGQGIINNGACIGGMSWKTVATSVVLYNAASFANSPATLAPAVLRAPAPNTSACRVVPKGFNGTVGSLRIMWNVNDGASNHLVCGKLVFWDKKDCSGSSFVYEIPGKWTAAKADNFKYATTSVKKAAGVVATGRSFSCLAAVKPPETDLCSTAACPPSSKCSLKNSTYAVCTCDSGTTMVDGYCVCQSSPTRSPFLPLSPPLSPSFPLSLPLSPSLSHSLPLSPPLSNDTFGMFDLPYTYCPPGLNMHSGACLPGILPDVADVAISIYNVPAFQSTDPPYIFRLKPNKCVTIPPDVIGSSKSVGMVFRAPGTNVRCTTITIYDALFCKGNAISSDVPSGNDMAMIPLMSALQLPCL